MTNARKAATAGLTAAALLYAALNAQATPQEVSASGAAAVKPSSSTRPAEFVSRTTTTTSTTTTTTTTTAPEPPPVEPPATEPPPRRRQAPPATDPPPETAQQESQPQPAPEPGRYSVNWDAIAQCESGGNWAINTGNGYYGGLQMNMGFWSSYSDGSYARPDLAPREVQIAAAQAAYDSGRGVSPWPVCGRRG